MSCICTKCGKKPANHEVYRWWETPVKQSLCCECHINDGGDPADWHSDCMRAYKKLSSETEICKHLRTSGTRKENGYEYKCLSCGFIWFKKDKPLTEAQKADKARFEHSQSFKGYRA